jgi:hypothetical protein
MRRTRADMLNAQRRAVMEDARATVPFYRDIYRSHRFAAWRDVPAVSPRRYATAVPLSRLSSDYDVCVSRTYEDATDDRYTSKLLSYEDLLAEYGFWEQLLDRCCPAVIVSRASVGVIADRSHAYCAAETAQIFSSLVAEVYALPAETVTRDSRAMEGLSPEIVIVDASMSNVRVIPGNARHILVFTPTMAGLRTRDPRVTWILRDPVVGPFAFRTGVTRSWQYFTKYHHVTGEAARRLCVTSLMHRLQPVIKYSVPAVASSWIPV